MFITFEGGEGSGKTTLIQRLGNYLKEQNREIFLTREPGGTDSKIAEDIRRVILNKNNTNLCSKAEALLYAAARIQHLHDSILPALNNKKIVICDRYLDSSYIYQGVARELGFKYIKKIHDFINKKNIPDITFLLDVEPKIGLARVNTRKEMNRLDLESEQFHTKVRDAYLELANKNKNRFIILDASKNEDEIFIEMIDKLSSHKKYKKYEKRCKLFK